MNKIENILIILAHTNKDTSHREGLLFDLFKTYVGESKKHNLSVSIIDLGKEEEDIWSPHSEAKDKIEEYQIKIKNADKIVFFHPIVWSLPSSDIITFINKVFVPGFAYTLSKGVSYGQCENKDLEIIAITENPRWQEVFVSNNTLSYFWNRIISDKCGFAHSKLHLIANYRKLNETAIKKWHTTIARSISSLNTKSSLLDLL